MAAKLVLSGLPFGYRFWRRMGLFKHGKMEQPAYAYGVFKKHYDRVDFPRKGRGFVALEIGPGDSLFSALVVHAHGGLCSHLIDIGKFAVNGLASYDRARDFLKGQGLSVPDPGRSECLDDILQACSAHYGTEGIKSLGEIPDATVDFIWSNAALEHIRRHLFLDTMRELRRVISPDGISSHTVDLRDHLGNALNSLRFSESAWESDRLARSGFYTNRIRFTEMLDLFGRAGFDPKVIGVKRWERLPTPRGKLSQEFRNLSDKELLIAGFDVLLRPG